MGSKPGFVAVKSANQKPLTTDHKPIGHGFESRWGHFFLFSNKVL